MRRLLVLAGLMAALSASNALALEKGDGLYAIQVTNGTADVYYPSSTPGYISADQHDELGVGVQYWRLLSSDYAFTFSGGVGFFSETDKPGTAAATGAQDFKYSQSSWNLRVGGDRVAQVGDRAAFYFGPGVEFWSGKVKFEGEGFPTAYESKNVTRFGLSGRVGGLMWLTERAGFNCQVGRYVAYATAEEDGAKATWFPSGFQASGGLVLKF